MFTHVSYICFLHTWRENASFTSKNRTCWLTQASMQITSLSICPFLDLSTCPFLRFSDWWRLIFQMNMQLASDFGWLTFLRHWSKPELLVGRLPFSTCPDTLGKRIHLNILRKLWYAKHAGAIVCFPRLMWKFGLVSGNLGSLNCKSLTLVLTSDLSGMAIHSQMVQLVALSFVLLSQPVGIVGG